MRLARKIQVSHNKVKIEVSQKFDFFILMSVYYFSIEKKAKNQTHWKKFLVPHSLKWTNFGKKQNCSNACFTYFLSSDCSFQVLSIFTSLLI